MTRFATVLPTVIYQNEKKWEQKVASKSLLKRIERRRLKKYG